MATTTAALLEEADGLVRRFRELLSGGAATVGERLAGERDGTLIALTERIGAIARCVDTLGTRIAGEVATRSSRVQVEPLAKRMGEKTPALLVARLADVPVGRAATWCRVGEAIGARTSLTGEILPAAHPAIAAELANGAIDADIARTILDTLDEVAPRLTVEKQAELERHLIDCAGEYPRIELARLCRRIPETLDPDGAEPREDEIRARAGVKELRPRNGLERFLVEADPERAGIVRAAFDAITAPARQVRFTTDGEDSADDPLFDDAVADTRTPAQRKLDALIAMAITSLRQDTGDLSGIAATVLVTIDHQALVTGVGTATIAGIDTPISASAARRLACDARIIPLVLGGPSQPLDIGAGRRLFTESQRLAMAVRDNGCIWPGCTEPPSRCQAAHIAPWRWNGPTDIRNGALLCPFHHRRF
ncbi:MAG: hypothetical protein JWP66_955, partial [Naasia sp.]|nr:hypothetical protein [Naasia sp.]